jgi:hypothetical protein
MPCTPFFGSGFLYNEREVKLVEHSQILVAQQIVELAKTSLIVKGSKLQAVGPDAGRNGAKESQAAAGRNLPLPAALLVNLPA